MDYKNTLLLPKTDFAMRAELPRREPIILERWQRDRVYETLQERRAKRPRFVLHDGPPYANGDCHMGHALNKTLKDIVIKSKSMAGFLTPYVPGWDCHGLPIEHKVVKDFGADFTDAVAIRKKCQETALHFIDRQREQFKRLGVFGDWGNPYRTMDPAYEAAQLRVLAKLVGKGLVYEGLQPVHWSTGCQTALAEAEVEYKTVVDPTVYAAFTLTDASAKKLKLPEGAALLIWTTTPWTLPSNLAVAVKADMEYVLAQVDERYPVLVSKNLREKIPGLSESKATRTFKGSELVGLEYQHPFLERTGKVYAADFVTEASGTGLVHISPGHGSDDFYLGREHGLEPLSPVDDQGKYTAECGLPELVGKYVFDANKDIERILTERGALWARVDYSHEYPHCWRSKTPIVFRAVKQWFINLEKIKPNALKAIDSVKWIPAIGVNRIRGTVETRAVWCISRQRNWGVPLPAFYQPDGKPIFTEESVMRLADIVEKEGSDVWFASSSEELCKRLGLPAGLTKGRDTLDVWIDSGSSHAAVLQPAGMFPCDMYLEGSDQHRAWFQSSLLLSVATSGIAPFKEVLTHGFIIDLEGRKLSKSNTQQKRTDLEGLCEQYGADVLRLWAAGQDYQGDIPFSEDIFARVGDVYRGLRNTFRILLANLHDFDLQRHRAPRPDWTALDRYLHSRLQELIDECLAAYKAYEFHRVYHALNLFCTVELSALYVDVLKDRMYCDAANDPKRRAAQTVMREMLSTLIRLAAPFIPYTAEEAWQALAASDLAAAGKTLDVAPDAAGIRWVTESVHLQEFPTSMSMPDREGPAFRERWKKLLALRELANRELEKARAAKQIGKSLEARLEVSTPDEQLAAEAPALLAELLIVSQVEIKTGPELSVTVTSARGKKCPRCWKYDEAIGAHPQHPDLSSRCAEVVETVAAG